MARIRGAEKFHIADVTENTSEDYTTDTPKAMERIVGISVDTKEDSETLYSDDEVEEDVYGTPDVSGKVELNYLTNESKVILFGGEIDKNGVYFPPADTTVKKHKAMGFRAPIGEGKYKYVWYQDVIFEMPSFKAETSENKPKTQTVEIGFKCYKNKKLGVHYTDLDGMSKEFNEVTAGKWFGTVYAEKASSAEVGV